MIPRPSGQETAAYRLLVLACSDRKRDAVGNLPALDRYDGPAFRVVRRYMRERHDDALDIRILSAKYGLVAPTAHIPLYDERLTTARAKQIQADVAAALAQTLKARAYRDLLLCMGRTYLSAIGTGGTEASSNSLLTVTAVSGPIGAQLVQLRTWLYGAPAEVHIRAHVGIGSARLRGVHIEMTRDEVLQNARDALRDGARNPATYQCWYVQVGEQRVSPKWLVSRLTGLPVGSFHSIEARRVLAQLGVEVACK